MVHSLFIHLLHYTVSHSKAVDGPVYQNSPAVHQLYDSLPSGHLLTLYFLLSLWLYGGHGTSSGHGLQVLMTYWQKKVLCAHVRLSNSFFLSLKLLVLKMVAGQRLVSLSDY